MSTTVRSAMMSGLGQLRHEPTGKRVRASSGGRTLVDSTSAVLLWEPRRVVPSWAVPVGEVTAELVPAEQSDRLADDVGLSLPELTGLPILDPSIPFAAHTADGRAVDIRADGTSLPGAGFLLDDPDLDGYVALAFDAFDEWWEEDVRNVGHPRDPFHRIDVLPSSRSVRLELDGQLLAESTRAVLLFETLLPVRFYLPPEDVAAETRPSATRSTCAYKGHASYLSPVVDGREVDDLAWTYAQPLPEAADVAGRIAFFDERVDVVLDGVRRERPVTPWSRR